MGNHAAISAEISGTTYTDEQIRETVKETWKEHHYLLDLTRVTYIHSIGNRSNGGTGIVLACLQVLIEDIITVVLGVEGIHVYVLYPKGKVSEIQEKQFTTLGQNITRMLAAGSGLH